MAFTDRLPALGHDLEAAAGHPNRGPGGVGGILEGIAGTVGHLAKTFDGVFGGFGRLGLGAGLTKALVGGFFHGLVAWVASGAAALVGQVGLALSSTTRPVLSGAAFEREFAVMAVLGAAVALPMLLAGAIQAIARQEVGELLRSALVRLPLALVFTGVAVQLVALGLSATDEASALVLHSAAVPTRHLLQGLTAALVESGGVGGGGFGAFLVAVVAAVVAFVLWLELAVRSAAIAAASLFLPLALAGLAWPATSHWARRLAETLAALVCAKLVIAAVLALAVGTLGSEPGLAGIVEGVALLAMAAAAPFALLRLIPAVESGAIAHLEGQARRVPAAAERLGQRAAGVAAGGGLGGDEALAGAAVAGDGDPLTVIGPGPYGVDRSGGGLGGQVASWDVITARLAEEGRPAEGSAARRAPVGSPGEGAGLAAAGRRRGGSDDLA